MHVLQHQVRYHEADAQGFLFNGRFLELADVAMTEFVRKLGWPYQDMVERGVDPSVVSASLQFTAPARFEDVLDVHTDCSRVGGSSFDLVSRVTRGSEVIADMALVYVNVDTATATSRPLPRAFAEALRDSLSTP